MTLKINPELDIKHLNQIYGDDATIIHMIFDAFITDSYPRWIALKNVITQNDFKEGGSILHGIKPSFAMAGITWLKPKIEEMELLLKEPAPTEVIMGRYEEINNQLDHLIPLLKSESERLATL
tara:strand:- start:256 stop:624 length:369 start_codon:yes stop_codon:yes gene_type:complete